MILRFHPDASPGEREAVAAWLRGQGYDPLDEEGFLHLPGPVSAEDATAAAAFPGVEGIADGAPGLSTVRGNVLTWCGSAFLVLGLLVLLASNIPALLGPPADPLRSPEIVRPSWPLLAWYASIDRAPSWFPVALLPLLGAAVLLLWPILARPLAERRPRVHTALGVLALAAGAGLALLGLLA